MKHWIAVCLCIVMAGAVCAAPKSARRDQTDFQVSNIKLSFMPTPLVRFDTVNNMTNNSPRNRWCVVDCSFTPSNRNRDTTWYDDVTMEGLLVIATGGAKGSTEYIVLTGKTRFFTIPGDGKSHSGMFFVPPRLLDRYLPSGKAFSTNMIIGARVQFFAPGRVLLGEGFWMSGKFDKKESVKTKRYFENFEKNYSDVIRLRGGLYSKEKTPWADFNYDYYDLIYDETVSNEADQQGIRK